MIYFKCSQCGESMEAPASLRGQLLRCPKCNLHQTVPTYLQKKKVFLFIIGSLILLGIITGIGLLVKEIEDQHRKESEAAKATEDYVKDFCKTIGPWLGTENIDRAYAAMTKLVKETPTVGYTTGLAMLAAYAGVRPEATLEHSIKMVKMAAPLAPVYDREQALKIAGQLERIYPEKGIEDIFSITVLILKNTWMHKEQIEGSMQAVHEMVDMGISPDEALATMLTAFEGEQPAKSMQAMVNLLLKLGGKTEIPDEPNIEPNASGDNKIKEEDKTEQATFKRMKDHIDNEIANGLIPVAPYDYKSQKTTPAVSKNKEYKPDYSDVDKISDELDRKEAKKLGLTLGEYKALQRLWESSRPQGREGEKPPIKLKPESREFSQERLAQNNFIRGLFDVSQGNKRRPGPDAYLTPEEIKGRQKLLLKYKRLARLQLKKERLEKLGQEAEVEKLNLKIEKISQDE